MKVINNVKVQGYSIDVDDIVLYEGKLCLVIKDGYNEEFPYRLLDVNNGCVVEGYKDLDCLNSDECVDFYTDDAKIILGDKE